MKHFLRIARVHPLNLLNLLNLRPSTRLSAPTLPVLTGLLLVAVLSACGGAAKPTATAPQNTPTPFPTYQYVVPTNALVAVGATAEATPAPTVSSAATLDPDKVAAGQSRYAALDCASCHGADGKSTAKGKPIVPTTLTEAQFTDFLRTGGKLGSEHLYASNRVSDAGVSNLYAYVLSLGAAK